ncbi:hypothetical protein [Kingella kingae]|nr:hypothetical protein [Kingella kingae]
MKLAHFLIIGAAMTTALPTLAAPSHQITTVGHDPTALQRLGG